MKLAAIFTDHMVLQRRTPIALFGDGSGHGRVEFCGTVTDIQAEDGFLVYLPAQEAGGPYEMTVTLNGETTVLTDILIGDVYLAGGQSNMAMRVEETVDIPRTPNPRIRHYTEGHYYWGQSEPARYAPQLWQPATDEYIKDFTAIGFGMAQILQAELDVPIGILSCNIGATRVDAWTAPEIVNSPEYQAMIAQRHPDWTNYDINQNSWPYVNRLLYIVPYTVAGVLWYQGESNRLEAEALHYHTLLTRLIENWRDLWQAQLPFYIVQIAPFADSADNDWPHIRQRQEWVTKEVPGTYLCTLVHTGETDNIHPTKKLTLATEVANAVLTNAFGYDLEYCGPVCDTAEKTAEGMRITFTHADGLHFDGEPADLQVYDAAGTTLSYTATVDGNALTIAAPDAARVTLGWQNAPTHNLYNAAGFLASPFFIEL